MGNQRMRKGIMILAACFLMGMTVAVMPQTVYATEAEGVAVSSDSSLKSFSISTGTMTPEFSPEVTAYTVQVTGDVEKINVTCSTSAADAKVVEAGGFKDLQEGSNSAHITVQAADGSQTTYTITIIRGEGGSTDAGEADTTTEDTNAESPAPETTTEESFADEQTPATDNVQTAIFGEGVTAESAVDNPIDPNATMIPVGGDTIYAPFQVNTTFPAELMPAGFVMENYSYHGVNVQSAYYALGDIRLLYLCAADGGNANFRIYYEDTDTFMDYVRFDGTNGKFIIPVRYQAQMKIPDNYTGSYLPWPDTVVACYIYTELTDNPIKVSEEMAEMEGTTTEDTSTAEPVRVEDLDEDVEFYLIYAMNQNGEEGFYLYDIVEDSYQRYVERDTSYDLDQSYFKYKDMAHKRFGIICVLAVLLVIAVFAIVNLIMQNRELKAELDDEDDGEENEEEEDDGDDCDDGEENETPIVKEGPVKKPAIRKEIPARKPEVKVESKSATKPEVKPEPEAKTAPEPEISESELSLEEKIISQLQLTQQDNAADKAEETVRSRKASNFKMINLSREPEPTGLDDDFEFEFINLDDE